MSNSEQDSMLNAVHEKICRLRREQAAASPEAFAEVYLSHHFTLPASPMHRELFGMLAEATGHRGERIAVAAPRGHAKSTVVSLAYVLWSVLYGHEKYVLIASATKPQATQLLKHVKDEFETNDKLHADFSEVLSGLTQHHHSCSSGRGASPKPSPWRGNKLQLPGESEGGGAMIQALGLGQQIRGLRHGQHRPSLIVVDDLETPEHVETEDQRRKTDNWFHKTLLKAGDTSTNVVVVGTVLHYDALLARLIDPESLPGWIKRRYRALIEEPSNQDLWARWADVLHNREDWEAQEGLAGARAFLEAHREAMEEGGQALWPEKDSVAQLMELREVEGRLSFASEKQNEPLDPDQCLFREDDLRYWEDEHGSEEKLLAYLGDEARIYIAWDPSMGNNPRRGDYSAIVVTAYVKRTDVTYVLVGDIERRKPDEAIARILEYAALYRPRRVAIEANGFQERLSDELKKAAHHRNLELRIKPIRNTGNKQGRIEGLEPRVAQGRLRFNRKHRRLLEQLRQFPLGQHDDGPDALEMAVAVSKNREAGVYLFSSKPEHERGGWSRTRYLNV